MKILRFAQSIGRSYGGFSLAELSVVVAVIGSLSVLSLPVSLTYYQTAQVRGAASDIASYLNQGRQLAIQRNQNVCVSIGTTAVQYYVGGCAGALWLGSITNSTGSVRAPDGITLTTTANPVFSYLGAAAPAATITVSQGTRSLNVIVSASGRVTVGP